MSSPSRGFAGFPAGALACTPIPNLFFGEVLPAIDDLDELQVTLQAFRLVSRKKGYPRYLTVGDFLGDGAVVAGLRLGGGVVSRRLERALARAVERGTLLTLTVERDGKSEGIYLVNGEHGRQAVEAIRDGKLDLGQVVAQPAETGGRAERPGVFALYEQNVGLLTPLLAEELAEAERLYPADWLEAAFRQAVAYNRRSWKYIQRVLERWAIEGKQDEEAGRGAGKTTEAGRYRRRGPFER